MSDVVISAENLGKKYLIGHQSQNGRYTALRDVLAQNARNLWQSTSNFVRGKPIIQGDSTEEVWALRDVSFEIKRGEVVGIIGRNGAGKSTLLKILSRITEPSAGRVTLRGRVATLLEVGTGFHPELTGRENIFLNGAVLGMSRVEIKKKFDEIVNFAEVEKFLDTPVKRYSSGMYVRLAFSVAAHLEPECLLIDEVLAVGDALFQKKCLGKMGKIADREGRTILFVSHNMAAIESLCTRCILLHDGTLLYNGSIPTAIQTYSKEALESATSIPIGKRSDRKGNGQVQVTGFRVEDGSLEPVAHLRTGQECHLAFEYCCPNGVPHQSCTFSFAILNHFGGSLILHRTNYTNGDLRELGSEGVVRCKITKLPLTAGRYFVGTYCEVDGETTDDPGVIAHFDVVDGDFFGTGQCPVRNHSPIVIDATWRHSANEKIQAT